MDFTLPELGENVATGDVVRVLVKPGDVIKKDQTVLELETDKATIEVPSSVAGRVSDVRVKVGDKIKVGQVILSVEGTEAAAKTASAEPAPSDEAEEQPASAPPAVQAAVSSRDNVVDIRGARPQAPPVQAPPPESDRPAAPASPGVRRLARELGVDVDDVPGTGPAGRISLDDVKAHTKRLMTMTTSAPRGVAAAPLPDFARWGAIDRQPMNNVRRKTAEHLTAAWSAIPHVTQCELADVTMLESLRKRYGKQAEAAGGNLTFTAIAVKVVAAALKIFPQFNASVDLAAGEIILKKYVSIGIAVDTDRGLLVPVIRDADTKNITEISVDLLKLSEKARARKLTLEEMQGGTFSISNLGGIGGTFFTPIVNLPEVAILGISRARMEPVFSKETGQFVPRLMLPLSLSYDHRVIDGADGIRFLRWVADALEQPFLVELQG